MSSRRYRSYHEREKVKDMYNFYLQKSLDSQKESDSMKSKLNDAKERKEALLNEIRFLKQRRSFLSNIQSQNAEHQIAIQSQKTDDIEERSGRSLDASEPTIRNPACRNSQPAMGSMWNLGSVGKDEVRFSPWRVGKKSKDLFTNGKRSEKRKISWQDQVSLKA